MVQSNRLTKTFLREYPLSRGVKQMKSSTKRAIAARANGREGGLERALRFGPEVLAEWSSWGGKAVVAKYGREYFVELRKRRKHYPKYSQPAAQPSPRLLAGKRNGEKGGNARAERHSPKQLREWARMGGIATRERHGLKFYRKIRKMRSHYKKGYLQNKTKKRMERQADRIIQRLEKKILGGVEDYYAGPTRRN
jgi:hypothetical protein